MFRVLAVDYCSTKAACLAFHEALQFEIASQYVSTPNAHLFRKFILFG